MYDNVKTIITKLQILQVVAKAKKAIDALTIKLEIGDVFQGGMQNQTKHQEYFIIHITVT